MVLLLFLISRNSLGYVFINGYATNVSVTQLFYKISFKIKYFKHHILFSITLPNIVQTLHKARGRGTTVDMQFGYVDKVRK